MQRPSKGKSYAGNGRRGGGIKEKKIKASADLCQKVEGLLSAMILGQRLEKRKTMSCSDFLTICILISNDAEEKGTGIKEVVHTLGKAPGTARACFERLRKKKLAHIHQKVGRSLLFRPTKELILQMERWAEESREGSF